MKELKLTSSPSEYIDEIIQYHKKHGEVIIDIESWEIQHQDLLTLTKRVEDYYVKHLWDNKITFQKGVSTQNILQHTDLILRAAHQFRETANHLMQKLATKYDVNMETGKGLYALRVLNDHENRLSVLDKNWQFSFHGYECCLTNKKTGQWVDIIFITRPEFGALDPYFFLKYIETTKGYDILKSFLNDSYENSDQSLMTLEAHGLLDRILSNELGSRGSIHKSANIQQPLI